MARNPRQKPETDAAAAESARGPQARRSAHANPSQETFNDLMKLFREVYRDESASPKVTDAVTQALLTVLGSGPAFAALETLVSASQANGLMYANSVAVQQQTNIHAMTALTRCVNAMLNIDSDWPEAEIVDRTQKMM